MKRIGCMYRCSRAYRCTPLSSLAGYTANRSSSKADDRSRISPCFLLGVEIFNIFFATDFPSHPKSRGKFSFKARKIKTQQYLNPAAPFEEKFIILACWGGAGRRESTANLTIAGFNFTEFSLNQILLPSPTATPRVHSLLFRVFRIYRTSSKTLNIIHPPDE